MECINAATLRRKSRQMGHPVFVAGVAKALVDLAGLFQPTHAIPIDFKMAYCPKVDI